MLSSLFSFDRLAALAIVFLLYLTVKGLDRLQVTLAGLHDDYRKVNELATREAMEAESQI